MKTHIRNLLLTLALLLATHRASAQGAAAFPIATNSGSVQFGTGVSCDGTNYAASYISGTNVTVRMFSTNGTLIGSPIIVGGSDLFPPATASAFGQTNTLVIWTDGSAGAGVTIFGQFISRAGTKVGSRFNVLASAGSHGIQIAQALASDGTNFLAVWQDKILGYFYGQIVTPSGSLSGAEFLISGQEQNGGSASACFMKTNYLVVWQSNNGPTGNNNRTYGSLVSKSGAAGIIFQISAGASTDQNPLAIAFDGTNCLVAWNHDVGSGSGVVTNWDIFGRVVSQTGTLPGSELVLVGDAGSQVLPSLAFDGANYLMAWGQESFNSTNSSIPMQFFNRSGSVIGPQFSPFAPHGTNQPLVAGLVFGGGRFAVAGGLGKVIYDVNFEVLGIASGELFGMFIPASGTAPRLAAAGTLSGGQFPLELTGTPGINYAILATAALSQPGWTSIVTNSPTNGTFKFSYTDTGATNASRIYRALRK